MHYITLEILESKLNWDFEKYVSLVPKNIYTFLYKFSKPPPQTFTHTQKSIFEKKRWWLRSLGDTRHAATKALFHVVYRCKIVSTPVTLKSQCNDNNLTMFGVKYKHRQLNMCHTVGTDRNADRSMNRNTYIDTYRNTYENTYRNTDKNTNRCIWTCVVQLS